MTPLSLRRCVRATGRGLAAVLALACASPTPQALLDARAAYQAAEADAAVSRYAGVELHEAGQALDRAERAWSAESDPAETEHLAYLASRRVELAESAATRGVAIADAETLTSEREKMLLEIRTLEADRAISSAERARIEAEMRSREAETARLDAEQARRTAEDAVEREKKLREELADLQARETERGLVLTLGDVLFDVGQATLKPGAMQNLYRLATFLRENPERQLLVEGHTDSTGSDALNLDLSRRRAEAVTSFLAGNGVDPSRMEATGYGKAYPVAGNESAAGRQQNRRVEVVILDAGQKAAEQALPTPPLAAP